MIERGTINRLYFATDYTLLLIRLYNQYKCIERLCIVFVDCNQFTITETDTDPNPLVGEVSLPYVGEWDYEIYGIDSETLDIELGTLLESTTINVFGESECVIYPDENEPTNCPMITIIDGGFESRDFKTINGLLNGLNCE